MPATKIQAAERPVGDVFSDSFQFSIPRYQRPYAWTTEQAGEMFDDLLAAAMEKASYEEVDPYFLGSVVLVKDENSPSAEVVDGQQRLTTLTILLSCLREHVTEKIANSLEARIFQKGDAIKGTIDQPRLTLRGAVSHWLPARSVAAVRAALPSGAWRRPVWRATSGRRGRRCTGRCSTATPRSSGWCPTE